MTNYPRMTVFIGRFQPFHLGHMEVVHKALGMSDHLCILIGSASGPRTYRNPFTYEERKSVILETFQMYASKITVLPLEDRVYNDTLWIESVQKAVDDTTRSVFGSILIETALIGHGKDNSSYYLKIFPQFNSIDVHNINNISSTTIRREYFFDGNEKYCDYDNGIVPFSTTKFLFDFKKTNDYQEIKKEVEFIEKYKSAWSASPYPPIFVTTDACVIQSGHVLLVQRKAFPGVGLWALPGGFLKQDEKVVDGMIRELKEETKIKVPIPVLKGNIKASNVFDDPHRSSRGRTITHGYLIHLPPETELPKVKGSDDAKVAKWVPLAEVNRNEMFEDHYHILNHFSALL